MAEHKNNQSAAAYWRAMTALQRAYGRIETQAVFEIVGTEHRRSLQRYISNLLMMRVIEPAGPDSRRAQAVRIINDGEAPPLRVRPEEVKLQQPLWATMRNLGHFSVAELAVSASTDVVHVPPVVTNRYVVGLWAAGYLVPIKSRQVGPMYYRLLPAKNTGPRAPLLVPDGCFDLNDMKWRKPLAKGGRT